MKGYVAKKGNRWYAVIYQGIDPVTGRERRSWHPAGAERADAERLAARLAAELDGRNDDVRSLSFGAFLTSRWLPGKRLVVADTTYDGYRRNVESHIVPALGRISLRRLRPHHLETFYDGLLHPRDDRHPLAPKTVSISRTTAYRYFPSQRALLAAAHPETAVESLLPDNAPEDVAARLDIVVTAYTRTILENESQQRTMLRLSLEADPEERSQLPLRQGRVITWLEEALAPLQPQLPRSEVQRLAIAIRSATGIEALSWLTDVAGLSRKDAVALMRWSAHAMLEATTGARSGTGRKRSRGRPGAAPSP